MTLKILHMVSALVLSLLPQLATAQGNLVVNGTFTGNANGWAIVNAGGFAFTAGVGNPAGSVSLDNVAPSVSTDPTASQTINGLIPRLTYAVSGQYMMGKDRGGGSSTNTSFGVAIDGVSVFETIAPTNVAWRSFSVLYTAASTSAVVSLSSQMHGTGISYWIDNIALQPLPMLTAKTVGTNLVLSWSTNVVGFGLQSSTNFTSDWLNVTNNVVIAGSNSTVTLNVTGRSQLFRLKQ